MTADERAKYDTLRDELTQIRVKLYGNGHRKGSIDGRLESVEENIGYIKGVVDAIKSTALTREEHDGMMADTKANKKDKVRWVLSTVLRLVPWATALLLAIKAVTA